MFINTERNIIFVVMRSHYQPAKERTFYQKVYDVVRQVPEGRVTTYGAIARFLGTGRSARLVGWAMNQSHAQLPPVPAHRVVNRNGLLSGKNHFAYPEQMMELLEDEGLDVANDQVMNFKERFWNPADHLDLEDFM